MIVAELGALCWHGICGIRTITLFAPRHAIKRSFEKQSLAALYGVLRGNACADA
jgi:hypothetical protein